VNRFHRCYVGRCGWVLALMVGGLEFDRWEVPDRLQEPAVVNQSTHSKAAYSTWSRPFQGPGRRSSSVCPGR
jgi:hypothetical protein